MIVSPPEPCSPDPLTHGFDVFELDGELLARVDIGPFHVISLRCLQEGRRQVSTRVDIAKATSANLALDAIFIPDSNVLEWRELA